MKCSIDLTSSWKRLAACSALIVAWGSVTAYGLAQLWTYDATPGERHLAPTTVAERSDRFTLLVFLHPQCPCSRASVAELARLMAQAGDRIDARVLFSAPRGDVALNGSSLQEAAAAIPGVSVSPDRGGELAARYGAATSGHVVLYRPDGALAFSGGITASRGHEGDNVGRSTILSIVSGQVGTVAQTPVFGCALFDAPAMSKADRVFPSHKGNR